MDTTLYGKNKQDMDKLARKAAELIKSSRKLVVFTGAGVSTESGIPDFRSPGGIWEKYDSSKFTIDYFISDPEIRKIHWEILTQGGMAGEAEPNYAHTAIAELNRMGKLDCVITQNIDFLHQKAGVPDEKVFEIHGSMRQCRCMKCHKIYPMEEVKKRLDSGEADPHCPVCSGIIKPDVVMFGEMLPELVLEEAAYRASTCDMMLIIGSSLVVYPAAGIPLRAAAAGARIAIINYSETSLDSRADVIIRSRAGEAMQNIMAYLKADNL
jgi:NAD-dependent deacetylase